MQGDVLVGKHELEAVHSAGEGSKNGHDCAVQLEGARVDVLVLQHVVQDLDGRAACEVDVLQQDQRGRDGTGRHQVRPQQLQAGVHHV